MRRMVPRVSLRNYLAVGPRGASNVSSDDRASGYTWEQSVDGISRATQHVRNSIESVQQRYSVAEDKIFLAGVGAGGTMALRIAVSNPTWFAGCVSLGGAFPSGLRPLSAINEARGQHVFLMTSDEFPTYSAEHICTDLRLLFCAGIDVTGRQYNGTEDAIKPMLDDVDRWAMGIATGRRLLNDPNSSSSFGRRN